MVDIQTLLKAIKVFYSPTDAQVNCLKSNFKIYIKIDIKIDNIKMHGMYVKQKLLRTFLKMSLTYSCFTDKHFG
jgi:hypothetical protein